MTVSFVLYLAYHGLALGLCLWAAATAIPRVAEHGAAHRAWTLVAALGAPIALFAACFAVPLGHPEVRPLGALLPVLAIAAAWSNVMTLRDQGLALKLLHAPILVWNVTLAAVFAVRVYQDLTGADLGTPGTTIAAGHALVQQSVGAPDALARPTFMHLPLCIPLCLRYLWPQRLALWSGAAVSGGMLWTLVTAMPIAHDRVRNLRETGPGSIERDVVVGVALPLGDHIAPTDARGAARSAWLGLGADIVTFEVGQTTFDDPALVAQMREEIAFAREQNCRVVVFVRPDTALRRRPAPDLETFATGVAKAQWLSAEQLAPDVLVLHNGPYGRLMSSRAETGTIDAWLLRIARDAQDVRRANPDVQVAVAVESRAPHGARLFERLCADDSPVDLVGLTLDADAATPHDLRAAIDTWTAWLLRAPGKKPVWIMGVGVSAVTGGGEVGQWNVIGRFLSFAARQPRVAAVLVEGLIDDGTGHGLMTPDGRPRLAYRRLRDLAFRTAPEPPR